MTYNDLSSKTTAWRWWFRITRCITHLSSSKI